MVKRQGGFLPIILILGIVVITAVASGFYFFKKSLSIQNLTKSSSNAKQVIQNNVQSLIQGLIYKNSSLNFEFNYGQNLSVKEDSEQAFNQRGGGDFRKNFAGYVEYEPGKFLGAVAVLDQSGKYDLNPFTVWVFDNPDNLTIDSWYKNYWYYPFVWGDFTYEGKVVLAPNIEATVSGQPAKSGVVDYQPGKPKFVYISKNKKIYLFRIIGNSGDKILESFKFIN